MKNNKHNVGHPQEDQVLFVLQLTQAMFEKNGIACSDVAALVSMWSLLGLDGRSCLHCKSCNSLRVKKKANSKNPNSNDHRLSTSRLTERSIISFPTSGLPPHLYFQVDAVPLIGISKKVEFMEQINWPFKLNVLGEVYTLISCGYWGNNHYWVKVLRTVQGVTGVWLHNDLDNAGYAQMVDSVPGSISFVNTTIDLIRRDNPKISSGFPFTHMNNLLNISYNGVLSIKNSDPPKTSNPPLMADEHHETSSKGSHHMRAEESGANLSEDSGGESEEGSTFHPPQTGNPLSSPPREPIKIRLCLNPSHPKQGSPRKAPLEVSHRSDTCNVGHQTGSTDPPPGATDSHPSGATKTKNMISISWAGNSSQAVVTKQPEPKSEAPTNPPGKKCGQPKKKPQIDSAGPVLLTDAEWDHIEACAAAN
ncbi:hypothetical protein PCANC_15395 [Puccinia coronata f. sp. avenae]|uniref:Uncharacterized protein n=1 Tax=Puccinia coronata f. sp. avenae TaxID=200324 RepID=A0A2N5SU97_9BASI|nr:hypothetical protein PCANC_15395 [Puccinia coronata f. sp. avenae]